MPGGDRTGPLGLGPRTGRGAGYCRGYGMAGFANPIFGGGRGFGRGFGYGRGRGWRNRYYATGLPGWARGGGYPYGYDYGYEWDMPTRPARVADTKADEIAFLKEEASLLNDTLRDINKRIEELERKS
jgi:hypothetical protein